jgi:hypothetical protein
MMRVASSQALTELIVVGHAAGGDERACQAGRPPVEQDRWWEVGECDWRDSILEMGRHRSRFGALNCELPEAPR